MKTPISVLTLLLLLFRCRLYIYTRYLTNVGSRCQGVSNPLSHYIVDGVGGMQVIEPEVLVHGNTTALNEGIPFGRTAVGISVLATHLSIH